MRQVTLKVICLFLCYNFSMSIEIKQLHYINEHLPKNWLPYYIFGIYLKDKFVGKIVLREGNIKQRYYDGHIGYSIDEEYRGHHYAYQACLLIKDIAKEKGFKELVFTCNPDNIASKKTIEKLQATYIETKPVPKEMQSDFKPGDKIKDIYILELEKK